MLAITLVSQTHSGTFVLPKKKGPQAELAVLDQIHLSRLSYFCDR